MDMSKRYFQAYHPGSGAGDYLGKGAFFLVDRPGSLAELASVFSKHSINIIFFHYNRSEHPNRVLLEVKSGTEGALDSVSRELLGLGYIGGEFPAPRYELGILDTKDILKIEVQLTHSPGTLGGFAKLLSRHGANVIYMAYNEDISETSAHFTLVTQDPAEIERLLKDMNGRGYYYSLIYRGAGQKEVDDIIGLNLVERFFFQLKKLLDTDDIERVRKLVNSSQRISDTLVMFSREAGKHFEEGDVITNVLAFASASLMKTGARFSWRALPPVAFGGVTFHAFRLPTGGNINILESREECVMIDGGYGLYYEDAKRMLRESGLDPAKIGRIYLSHADADHAGMSGYFAEEFGSRVYLHRDARGIIAGENRAWGSDTPLLALNHQFTVLVNEFTGSRFPDEWSEYGGGEAGELSGFRVIDSFSLAGQTYKIIESLGGHIPGQVFILGCDSGLVFTGDYLLKVESLDPEERRVLNIPRFMMTSTNVNSGLFRKEMDMLRKLVSDFHNGLGARGKEAVIVPGHGDYYPFRTLQ